MEAASQLTCTIEMPVGILAGLISILSESSWLYPVRYSISIRRSPLPSESLPIYIGSLIITSLSCGIRRWRHRKRNQKEGSLAGVYIWMSINIHTYMNKISVWSAKCILDCGAPASLFDFTNSKHFLFATGMTFKQNNHGGINCIKAIDIPWIRGLVSGPSPRGTGFDPRPVHVRFVVKTGTGTCSSQSNFVFFP